MQITVSPLLPHHMYLLSVTLCKLVLSEEKLRLPHLQIVHSQTVDPSACHSTVPEVGMSSSTFLIFWVPSQSQMMTYTDLILRCIMSDLWNKFSECEQNLKELLYIYIYVSPWKKQTGFGYGKLTWSFKTTYVKCNLNLNVLKRYANKPLSAGNLRRLPGNSSWGTKAE